MIGAILGQKIGQSQRFTEEGRRLPVTLIAAGPCPVIQMKTPQKEGYWAVQLGLGERKIKHTTKPILGHIKGANLKIAPRFLQEVRIRDQESGIKDQVKVGDAIKVGDIFAVGDKIQVTGISKGKGFAGVVKRWHFKGGPRTHGQSDRERAPGSIGSTTTPGRVYKGKRMAGHMGDQQVTVKNLEVVEVDPSKNLLVVKGLVPSAKGGLLFIQKE